MPEKIVYKKIDQGVFPARCYSIVDIGTQTTSFNGEEKMKHKIRVTWEFPTELEIFDEEKGLQPFVLAKEYTLSLFEQSDFRKDLETWLGRSLTPQEEAEGYDTDNLLGMPCQIQVIHVADKKDSSKIYANINGILSLPKGMTVPEQINPSQLVNIEDWGSERFTALPEFVQKKIMASEEWKTLWGLPEFDQ